LLAITKLQEGFIAELSNEKLRSDNLNLNSIIPSNSEYIVVLAIAYYNTGVELEHLKKIKQSLVYYKKAIDTAKSNLGFDDNLMEKFYKVYNLAVLKVDPS